MFSSIQHEYVSLPIQSKYEKLQARSAPHSDIFHAMLFEIKTENYDLLPVVFSSFRIRKTQFKIGLNFQVFSFPKTGFLR